MTASTRKLASAALAAIGLSAGFAGVAKADQILNVTNLQFNQFDGSFNGTKQLFQTAKPTGWSIGPNSNGALIGVGAQGKETLNNAGSGGVYGVFNGTGFSNTVPAGTNFYQADGNPKYESTIFTKVSGLTAGITYDLQFQQAAGQQSGGQFSGQTTEQWKVFLGVGGIGTDCSSSPCTVTGPGPLNSIGNNYEADSTLMTTPSQSNFDWNSVTLKFMPTAADLTNGSATLTFLAWGNGGQTANEPPTVFLEGVNTTPVGVPEPATLTLLGVGFLGVAGMVRRRRGKRNVAG